jgi:hypothetical protein
MQFNKAWYDLLRFFGYNSTSISLTVRSLMLHMTDHGPNSLMWLDFMARAVDLKVSSFTADLARLITSAQMMNNSCIHHLNSYHGCFCIQGYEESWVLDKDFNTVRALYYTTRNTLLKIVGNERKRYLVERIIDYDERTKKVS